MQQLKNNSIIQRSLTGSIIVLTIVGLILVGHQGLFILVSLISLLGLLEFYSLFKNYKPNAWLGIASALFFLSINYTTNHIIQDDRIYYLMILPFSISLWIELFSKNLNPGINIALTWFGVLYIILPLTILYNLSLLTNEYNALIPLGIFILLWVYDTAAFIGGIAFGKHKLFERISPKKTWEGAFIGTIVALITGYVLSITINHLTHIDWIAIALISSVFGTIGDLFESALKRSVDSKDSGSLLPGHGGVLDRFDSLMMAVPMIYLYLLLKTVL